MPDGSCAVGLILVPVPDGSGMTQWSYGKPSGAIVRGSWAYGADGMSARKPGFNAGVTYVADDNGKLLVDGDGWTRAPKLEVSNGTVKPTGTGIYYADARTHGARNGLFAVNGKAYYAPARCGYVNFGCSRRGNYVMLADKDGNIPTKPGFLETDAYLVERKRYYIEKSTSVDGVPVYAAKGGMFELNGEMQNADPEKGFLLPPPVDVPVYRLYNVKNSDHLLTADFNEVRHVANTGDWRWEGVGFVAPHEGDADAGAPVFRLFNPNNGEHLLTKDLNEWRTIQGYGWRPEGVAFREAKGLSSTIQDKSGGAKPVATGMCPVYRLYNKHNGLHMLTSASGEHEFLKKIGYTDEGIGFYARKASGDRIEHGFWMSAGAYGAKDGRLWVAADGRIATNRVIDPSTKNDAGCGVRAFARPEGTIVRGKWNDGKGHTYLASNDGALCTDRAGWLVTDRYDGGLQRYWLEDSGYGSVTRGRRSSTSTA